MKLYFEVLGRRHLEWLRNLRNQNRQWFMDNRELSPIDQTLWFGRSCDSGDLNLVIKSMDGERVGFISVYDISIEGRAIIGRMMTDDKFKHQGYMERALIEVLTLCKDLLGIEELSLTVKKENIPARDLYVKFGFITYGLTTETLIMRKRL